MKSASVYIWSNSDIGDSGLESLRPLLAHMSGHVAILPSNMEHDDARAQGVAGMLPDDATAHIKVPMTGTAARRAFLTPSVLGHWIDRPVLAADATMSAVTLPQDIAQASHRIVVLTVDEWYRPGPFILDLPARFIHPRQRMRLLASSERGAVAAEVASAFVYDLCVIVHIDVDEGRQMVIATTDAIAAELMALALSELATGVPRGFTGPWEDLVVQRATELELGVVLPQQIRLIVGGAAANDPWSMGMIEHVRMRLGIPKHIANLP
ncbi:MAG: hypothetical protein KC435_02775 [Thermomicrobiales bacterium]|nr:hypothetical protein [Thermomicrobiales bacterium]